MHNTHNGAAFSFRIRLASLLKSRHFTRTLSIQGLKEDETALLTHGDAVTKIAPGFRATAWSQGHVVGIECAERKLYGTQFHPEVDLTVRLHACVRACVHACMHACMLVCLRVRACVKLLSCGPLPPHYAPPTLLSTRCTLHPAP